MDGVKRSLDVLASGVLDSVDHRILEQLADVQARIDPMPPTLPERVKFAISLAGLEAEIAELQRADDMLSGARSDDGGPTQVQTVTFASSSLTAMVSFARTRDGDVRIDGWVTPPCASDVEMQSVGGRSTTVSSDEDGRFVFAAVAPGMARFVLRPPSGSGLTAVITPFIEL